MSAALRLQPRAEPGWETPAASAWKSLIRNAPRSSRPIGRPAMNRRLEQRSRRSDRARRAGVVFPRYQLDVSRSRPAEDRLMILARSECGMGQATRGDSPYYLAGVGTLSET